MLVPINLPPGMYRNGTPYSERNRWADGNLVRWHNGTLRPIGGWERRLNIDNEPIGRIVNDPATETIRDMLAYALNEGGRQIIFGSNKGLYVLDPAGEINVISPLEGFEPGFNEPSISRGYGAGPYGIGAYGTARTETGAQSVPVQRWNFSPWGENIIAAGVNNGPIFEILPDRTVRILTNAPDDVADVIVTDQRIVMTIKNGDPEARQVIWSDRENNNVWASNINNFAGSRTLQGNGNLVGLYKVLGQVLILSQNDAFVGRYVGAPFVYGFERIGNNCEPVHPKAVVTTDRFAMWLGNRTFWLYDGTLRQAPSEVMDYIAETVAIDQVSKAWATTISDFSEVWWFYPDINGATSYVIFDYVEQHWATGTLDRSVGIDSDVFLNPLMVGTDGFIYTHELRGVAVDGQAFASTGPIEVNAGQTNVNLRYMFPDTNTKGDVLFNLKGRQFPTEPLYDFGLFPYENPISTSGVSARELYMTVFGGAAFWEVGTLRWDVAPMGYR